MKKLIFVLAAMLGFVGCASKGDLNALNDRVTVLEKGHEVIEQDHARLSANVDSLSSSVAELNSKVDRAFTKGRN